MEQLITIISHWSDPVVVTRYDEYLLIVIIVYSFIEVLFPPFPGDGLLIISGSIAGMTNISPVLIIGAAFVGSFTGSWVLYNFGYKMELKLLRSPKFSGLLDSKIFIKVERWLKHYGFWTLLVSRFIPVVRSGLILVAGMVNLDKNKSLAAVGVSIILSSTLLVVGGHQFGRSWRKVIEYLQMNLRLILGVVILVLALYFLGRNLFKLVGKKISKHEDPHE